MQEIKTEQAQELVSALADGELREAELARALALLQSSEEARSRWHDYHLVGNVLRGGAEAAMGRPDAAFMAGLRERLQASGPRPALAVQRPVARYARSSANDSAWRWKLVAGLSSLAVAAVLGWQLVAPGPAAVQLAAQPFAEAPQTAAAAAPAGDTAVMIRDPRLDQLIAAHQQQGGTSALQMPAGFLRNATFERPSR